MCNLLVHELGRLKGKYLHGNETGAWQKVDYTYNIRNWLTGINNPNSQGSAGCISQQMSTPTAQGNRPQKDFAGF